MEPKAGDTIRIVRDDNWRGTEVLTYTLEVYRHTLGYFASEQDREAYRFTPLCDPDLYGDGPESNDAYISNYGPYRTNQIPLFEIIAYSDDRITDSDNPITDSGARITDSDGGPNLAGTNRNQRSN